MAQGVGEIAHGDGAEQRIGEGVGDEPAIGDLPVGERRAGLAQEPAHERVVDRHEELRLVLVQAGRGERNLVGLVPVAAGEIGRRAVAGQTQHLLLAR